MLIACFWLWLPGLSELNLNLVCLQFSWGGEGCVANAKDVGIYGKMEASTTSLKSYPILDNNNIIKKTANRITHIHTGRRYVAYSTKGGFYTLNPYKLPYKFNLARWQISVLSEPDIYMCRCKAQNGTNRSAVDTITGQNQRRERTAKANVFGKQKY